MLMPRIEWCDSTWDLGRFSGERAERGKMAKKEDPLSFVDGRGGEKAEGRGEGRKEEWIGSREEE